MKKLFFFLIFIALGLVVYFGIYHPPNDMIYKVHSKIQGKKIIYANGWGFYPETVIPGFVEVEQIPVNFHISSKITVKLPYSNLLNFFNNLIIEVSFNINYNITKENSSFLFDEGKDSFKKNIINRIDSGIRKIISENVNNNNFSKEILKNKLELLKKSLDMDISFIIVYFPNWKYYSRLIVKLENTMINSEDDLLKQIIENNKQLLISRSKNRRMIEFFGSLEEISKKVSKSSSKELILKILKSVQSMENK